MTQFYGRERELKLLKEQAEHPIASLVVIRGRRRIGKSRLAEEFSKEFSNVFTFVGLPPEEGVTAQMERRHFMNELERQNAQFGLKDDDWDILFHHLANVTKEGKVLIILDEINWMGTKDPSFLGKLKTAWDLYFKKNPNLVMILSGSMASWIEKNILSSAGFFGRISLDIILDELPLHECNHFWDSVEGQVSTYEKFKVLSITGGVPLYLESINPKITAEENIRRLCFRKEGRFFQEYERIFSDIFSRRSALYKKIVEYLAQSPAQQKEIFHALQKSKSGSFSEYLDDLVQTGFVSRDYTWSLKDGKTSKLSHYRLSDNFLRFYLKYVEPKKEQILKGREEIISSWYTIMGLQFENLVVKNRKAICRLLEIPEREIIADNPYFQLKTQKTLGVQIDYMIQTRYHTLYLVEVKFSKEKVGRKVADDVREKVKRLGLPKGMSVRPVLIHVNGVTDSLVEEDYFSRIIDFGDLL